METAVLDVEGENTKDNCRDVLALLYNYEIEGNSATEVMLVVRSDRNYLYWIQTCMEENPEKGVPKSMWSRTHPYSKYF